MATKGKKYVDSAKLIDRAAQYDVNEAMELVIKTATAKFDETVELHVKLGVDSRHADQQVRGAIVLPEDFFGDMDFKVAGTKAGITAIQVDIKCDGLTLEIIREAFEKTRNARFEILDEVMLKAIPAPREQLSAYAPKTVQLKIDPDKIRDVIGKGGAVIQKITADTNTTIDIQDDGSITIAAVNMDDIQRAKASIEAIALDPIPGQMFYGKVVRIMNFGAFVEIAPGKDGLVHISKLENHRVEKVEDSVNIGDMTWVKVIEIDDKGRINLSRKDAYAELAKQKEEKKQ